MRPLIIAIIALLLHGSGIMAQPDALLMDLRFLLLQEDYNEILSKTDGYCSDVPETPEEMGLHDSIMTGLLYYRGQAFMQLARYDSALSCFRRAIGLNPLNPVYNKAAGLAYQKLGRIAEAREVYENIVQADTTDIKSRIELAALYLAGRDYEKGLHLYLRLLEGDSLNYFLNKQVGRCFLELDRDSLALASLETAFDLNPADPWLVQQVTNLYLRKKDIGNALSTVQKGLLYDSANADLLRLSGYVWFLDENHPMAIRDFTSSAQRDSSSVFTYKYMGISQFEEKSFSDARQSLLKANELDSMDAEITFYLGSACRWATFENDAVAYYLKTIELLKPLPNQMKNIHIELAELYKVLHSYDLALESYNEAMSYDVTDNTILFKIAQVYDHNLDQKARAIEYYALYLDGIVTDHVLFDRQNQRAESLKEHVQSRINYLKEELFFEE